MCGLVCAMPMQSTAALALLAIVLLAIVPLGGGEDLAVLRREAAVLRTNLERVERRIAAAEARAPPQPPQPSSCGDTPLVLDSPNNAVVRLHGGVKLSRIGHGSALWSEHVNATAAFASAVAAGYSWMDTAVSFGTAASLRDALQLATGPAAGSARAIRLVGRVPASTTGSSLAQRLAELRQGFGSMPHVKLRVMLLDGLHPSRSARLAMWRQALEMRDRGDVEAVGVSNWGTRHLAELDAAQLELPALVQTEFHVFLQNRGVVEWCQSRGVAVLAAGIAHRLSAATTQRCHRATTQRMATTLTGRSRSRSRSRRERRKKTAATRESGTFTRKCCLSWAIPCSPQSVGSTEGRAQPRLRFAGRFSVASW
jgi:diketogulonate reductase-like aldo/keto reductase